MDKLKHKTPPKSFLRYLLDEYILFRRDFVIETPASVEDCVQSLKDLQNHKHGFLRSRTFNVTLSNSDDIPHFVMLVIHSHDSGRMGELRGDESARAEGAISLTPDGLTVIAGTVVMSGWMYWIVITAALVFLVYSLLAGNVFPIYSLMALTMIIILWITMYSHSRYLLQQIEKAINNAEPLKITEKIKSNDIYENNNPSSMNSVR